MSEHIHIQHTLPVAAVKALNKSVLHRPAGLDEFQLHPMLLRPVGQACRDELRPVIHPDLDRVTALCRNPFQHPNHSCRRQIQVDLDTQCFTVEVVHHVEGAEPPAAP